MAARRSTRTLDGAHMDIERAKELYKRLTLSIWGSVTCILVGWPLAYSNPPLNYAGITLIVLAIVLGGAFYVFLTSLVSMLNRSLLVWVGGAFIFTPFGPLLAWFSMRRIAKQGFCLSETAPPNTKVEMNADKSGPRSLL